MDDNAECAGEIISLSNECSLIIKSDPYLSEKTSIKHSKLIFNCTNLVFSSEISHVLSNIVTQINGIVFTEFDGGNYELMKLVQSTGFKFHCASMGWISSFHDATPCSPDARLVNIDQYDKYKDRIAEIASTFDTSRYENIGLYKPIVRQMYQDMALTQWQNSKEIIIFFKNDYPIAYTTLSSDGNEGWLLSSCVDSAYRGGRVYFEMIRKGKEVLLKEKNTQYVKLECLASNIVVQKTWNKLGFKPNYSTVIFHYGL